MFDALIFTDLFAETYALLRRHIAGVSHAMRLRQPPGTTFCANWIVGHIVAARANVLVGLLGAPQTWNLAVYMRYIPESIALRDDTGMVLTEHLLRDLERSQNELLTILAPMTPETLQMIVGEQTIGAHLLQYHAHEAYHAGQLDIVCQFVSVSE